MGLLRYILGELGILRYILRKLGVLKQILRELGVLEQILGEQLLQLLKLDWGEVCAYVTGVLEGGLKRVVHFLLVC